MLNKIAVTNIRTFSCSLLKPYVVLPERTIEMLAKHAKPLLGIPAIYWNNIRSYTMDSEGVKSAQVKQEATTHFGFQTIAEEEKEHKVYDVFRKVAEKYDLMNDVMSFGIHRLWKDEFIRQLAPQPGTKLIDVAGGTGDIAFRFLNYVKNLDRESQYLEEAGHVKLQTTVTVCDINEHMLQVGQRRAIEQHYPRDKMSWLKGNAEDLCVEDRSYDAYTVAFGIRNCTHVKRVLKEAYRVLKPGGRFMCLEFSRVRNPVLRMLYDQYSFQLIPVMGHVIAQDWHSYQYLVESIRKFPNQEEFADWIRETGFNSVSVTDLAGGAVAIHSAFKI